MSTIVTGATLDANIPSLVAYSDTQLNSSRLILLGRRHSPEVRVRRVRVRRWESRVIESVERVKPSLYPDPLCHLEILAKPHVDVVHSAGPQVVPSCRIGLDVVDEILVHAFLIVSPATGT